MVALGMGCGSAAAGESGWIMTLRIMAVGVTGTVGLVRLAPAFSLQ